MTKQKWNDVIGALRGDCETKQSMSGQVVPGVGLYVYVGQYLYTDQAATSVAVN